MEKLISVWLYLGYLVYWIGWLGSMAMFGVSTLTGIVIGLVTFAIHIIILQILYWINGDGWIWNP